MRKFIIIFIIVAVILTSLVYVDYFNAKANNTYPKLSLKSEDDDAYIYSAIFYRVYYCKVNKKYMIGSYSEKNICPKNYEYVNDTYTNSQGIVISKRDLQLLTSEGIYTSEMVENMNSEKQVKDAVHVANSYLKNIYKVVNELEDFRVIVFPEFKEDEDDNYKWIYNEEEDYYCLSEDSSEYAKYDNEECGVFEKFKMDKEWCENYKNSTLIYEDNIDNLCESE